MSPAEVCADERGAARTLSHTSRAPLGVCRCVLALARLHRHTRGDAATLEVLP